MTREEIEEAIVIKKNELIVLEEQRSHIIRSTPIRCRCSDTTLPLSALIFVLPHWLEPPHGCSGGGYWHPEYDSGKYWCSRCGENILVPVEVAKDIKDGAYIELHVHMYNDELYLKKFGNKRLERGIKIDSIRKIPRELEKLDLQARLAALDA